MFEDPAYADTHSDQSETTSKKKAKKPAKKAAAKKAAAKKGAAKKPAKKAAAKKPAKKAAAKKPAKKAAAKKPAAKKAAAKKKPAAPKRTGAKRAAAKKKVDTTRRGAPDVVEKRRIAREFNTVFSGKGGEKSTKFDGRVLKRCNRLLEALSQPANMKAIEILKGIDFLLGAGYKRAEIHAKIPRGAGLPSDRVGVDVLLALHVAYGFRYETYRLAGFKPDTLEDAGIEA